jgi:pimeloyl-ACP methyl ester carboxylesterase
VSHPAVADAAHEFPVFFPAGDYALFGIFTRPTAQANGVAAVMLPGARHPGTTERNRFSVRVCRSLAALGCHTMRLDYHGTGESTGVVTEGFQLHRPFTEDVAGAVRWIRGRGLQRFLLMGSCFGARTALAAATTTEGMAGLVLVSAPPGTVEVEEGAATERSGPASAARRDRDPGRRSLRRLLGPRSGAALARRVRARGLAMPGRVGGRSLGAELGRGPRTDFVGNLAAVVKREVPVLLIYGEDDRYYEEFREARQGRLGRILEIAGALVDVRVLPGRVYGFSRLSIQDEVLGVMTGWVEALVPRDDGTVPRDRRVRDEREARTEAT